MTQNTRLNRIIDDAGDRLNQGLRNPWRRLSLLVISLLFGFLLASVVSSFSGQRAEQDMVVAAIMVLLTELASRIIYGRGQQLRGILWAEVLNGLKIGFTYGLFVEAFKLNS